MRHRRKIEVFAFFKNIISGWYGIVLKYSAKLQAEGDNKSYKWRYKMIFEKKKSVEIVVTVKDTDCGVACHGSGDDNDFAVKSHNKLSAKNKGERKTCDCE